MNQSPLAMALMNERVFPPLPPPPPPPLPTSDLSRRRTGRIRRVVSTHAYLWSLHEAKKNATAGHRIEMNGQNLQKKPINLTRSATSYDLQRMRPRTKHKARMHDDTLNQIRFLVFILFYFSWLRRLYDLDNGRWLRRYEAPLPLDAI